MATIVDSLLVTLGLDVSGYKKGAKEVEKANKDVDGKTSKSRKKLSDEEKKLAEEQKKRAKEIDARNKAIAQSMNKIRNEALGLLGVFTAGMGIKNFIESTIDSGASLSRMSKNLGMAAKDLAAYKLANQMAGGSAEGMVAQLQEAAADVSSLQLGKGLTESAQNTLRYAAMYGVSASLDDMKDATTLLKKRADIIAAINKVSPTQAMSVAKAMGISDDTYNLMKLGAAGIEKLKQSQEGLAASQARNADRAEAFRQKLVTLKNSFAEAATNVLIAFMPALEKGLKLVQQFANWVNGHEKEISGWIMEAVKGVGEFIRMMREMAPFILGTFQVIAGTIKAVAELIQTIGAAIRDILPSSVMDKIGGLVAKVMAMGGSEEAKYALAPSTIAPPVGAASSVSRNYSSSSSTDVKVGTVNIQTQATDAAGIAKSFGGAMQKYGYPAQSASGFR